MDTSPYQASINRLAQKAVADVLRFRGAGEPVMLVLLGRADFEDPFPESLQGEAW